MATQWFFLRDDRQQGPVPLEEMHEMARDGRLAAHDLIWSSELAAWTPAGEVGAVAAAFGGGGASVPDPSAEQPRPTPSAAEPSNEPVLAYRSPQVTPVVATERALDMLRRTRPWARVVAVMMFIAAGIMLLGGCIGALAMVGSSSRGRGGGSSGVVIMFIYIPFALLYIAPAVYLNRYASRITDVLFRRQEQDLEAALEAQKSFWKFVGISILVVIGVYILIGAIAIVVALM